MAGSLAAIGVIVAIFVVAREQSVVAREQREEGVAGQQVEAADTTKIATEVATPAPLPILDGLQTLPGGGAAALKVAQLMEVRVARDEPRPTQRAVVAISSSDQRARCDFRIR